MQDNNPEEYRNPEPSQFSSFIKNLNPFAYVIIVLAAVFFLYQIVGGVISLAGGMGQDDFDVKLSRIILIFSQFMFILAPTIFFTRLQTSDLKKTFRLNMPKPHLLIFAILGMFLIQPALQGYMSVQDYTLNHIPYLQDTFKQLKELFDTIEKSTLKIVTAYSMPEFIVVVMVICITPAICEEFLFRGFVMKNFERTAKPSIAIFLSGFLFAVYHFQPLNVVPLAMLGVYLGFVVYYSNSIFTGVICHFLNNFFATFLLYKFGKEDFETPHIAGSEKADALILAAVSLVMLISVMMFIYRFRAKPAEPDRGAVI